MASVTRQYVFQSTPPRGGQQPCANNWPFSSHVSIHAPARGATFPQLAVIVPHKPFQSTPPRGGQPYNHLNYLTVLVFQSTPPRGGQHIAYGGTMASWRFQSTPPRGGQPEAIERRSLEHAVSIHAPARGATLSTLFLVGGPTSFNPRPREGGNINKNVEMSDIIEVSIHAPARGATPHISFCNIGFRRFNPRPREGGNCTNYKSLAINNKEINLREPLQYSNNWLLLCTI